MELGQYLEIFIEESKEHLQACNENLLKLEKNPEDTAIINEIFRSAHTLKGMSATMGYEDLASLTHEMENVLDSIRQAKLDVSPGLLDIVFFAVDDLEAMVESIASGGDGKRNVAEAVSKLQAIVSGNPQDLIMAQSETAAAVLTSAPLLKCQYDEFELTVLQQAVEQGLNTYEITVSLREDCLLKAARVYMVFEAVERLGEIIKSSPSADQLEEEKFDSEFILAVISTEARETIEKEILRVSEVKSAEAIPFNPGKIRSGELFNEGNINKVSEELVAKEALPIHKKEQPSPEEAKANGKSASSKTIRVNIERLDILMNLFEELVIDRGRLEQISRELKNSELNETVERMSRISGDLQSIILTMRMVPVETVFNRFPKMIRQLARDLNKKLNLEIYGAETELDRTVVDEIGDPLVHLLRNAIDHGIEAPEIRRANGKKEEGTVKLTAFHSGNHVFIEIEDDGAGISRQRVLEKALKNGIISEQTAETMTDKQVYELIFASGFSTADKISDISGRGVGLDVVKSTIESLGGSVSIDSRPGNGSTFSIQLPLTLSIISVMLVEIQNEKYAIPLSSIIETAIVRKEEIMNAHNQKVINFRGRVVPLLFLKDLFKVPVALEEGETHSIVIVRKGEKMAALVVDSFIGQQEAVLKSLGNYLTDVFAISGATILGDGKVALIVDCNALIK